MWVSLVIYDGVVVCSTNWPFGIAGNVWASVPPSLSLLGFHQVTVRYLRYCCILCVTTRATHIRLASGHDVLSVLHATRTLLSGANQSQLSRPKLSPTVIISPIDSNKYKQEPYH